LGIAVRRRRARDERGQVVVLFALLVPMMLAMGAVVVGIGNWSVHAKNLQTKVDAAAFAGGAVWGFPCGADIDAEIEAQARLYFGSHVADDLTSVSSPHNPQVGGIGGDRHYVSLNQAQWWGGSFPSSDFSDPAGPVCESKILDVKATERDVSPLWKLIPLFPDIKKKARVQIEEVDGLTGLLPIAVRLPQPLSAAAVFYDEASPTKSILAIKPFRQVCLDPDNTTDCIVGVPPGLGHWTTMPDPADATGTWASFNVKAKTGVVVATSVRPACGAGTPPAGPPCLSTSPSLVGTPIDDFCGGSGTAVRCFDADGGGAAQTVRAGLHFIQGYRQGSVTNGRPELRRAWLENVDCPPAGYGGGYFNSAPSACHVMLTVEVDVGSLEENPPPNPPDDVIETRVASNVQMRYCHVPGGQTGPAACDPDLGADQFGVDQDMQCSGGPGVVTCSTVTDTHPLIATDSRENAFAIQIHLRRTTVPEDPDCSNNQDDPSYSNLCRFFYTGAGYIGDSLPPSGQDVLGAPVQRTYMGSLERTTPIEWMRLTLDPDCDPVNTPDDWVVGHVYPPDPEEDAASQPENATRCYVVDLGTAGGLARDQDEPPIAFNLGRTSSQRAYVECEPNKNVENAIITGCQWPAYAANKFDTTPYCPDTSGWFNYPKPAPFDNWPPFRCVLTKTGQNEGPIMHGFNERIFGQQTNPKCPDEDLSDPFNVPYAKGRNYWHRHNNVYDDETYAWDGDGNATQKKGNTLRSDDPRLVTLFFTTYDSFTDTGNEAYPIVGFGNFYVTGYGEVAGNGWKGGSPEDPCDDGNGLEIGAGNVPPPDIDLSRNTVWVWGHFVNDVVPAPFSTGTTGALCNPAASFQPCVAVLVE
jgi:Putative Flp pilus-assembly TadE/G-like